MKIPATLADEALCLGTLEPAYRAEPLSDSDIRSALESPIWPSPGNNDVFHTVLPGESVCMVVSDGTRRTAADRILPVLLDGLKAGGCLSKDMFFLFATGIHRAPSADEIQRILGPAVAKEFDGRIFIHNADDDANLVVVGTTARGHRVRVNRRAIEADKLILIGAALYHYHAGFGGGRKSLVPGLAARETIAYNHSLTLDPTEDRIRPGVDIGALDGNPVSEEMLEGARMCRPDIIINTVLTSGGELAGVFSGDLDLAHRAACELARKICGIQVDEPADLVIASAGKASNWIQSHKSLYNAHRAVRSGGWVVLEAPCAEGIGDERFRHWITTPNVRDIFAGLRASPEVLGQTALSTRMRGANTILVTKLNDKDIADLGIETAPDVETAVERALARLRKTVKKPTYYLMPHAGLVVPFTSRS